MSNSEISPQNGPPKRGAKRFIKPILATVGVVGAAGLVGGSWKLWTFIQEDLAPTVAEGLSESLNRPVKLGDLQRFGFTGLEFGPSEVPAHPYPDKAGIDRDSATVEAVQVKFDLWKVLTTRTLNLDVTLVEPRAYINQTADGEWLETKITTEEEKDEWFKTQLDRIKIERGQVILDPHQKEARRLENLNGAIALKDNNDKINLNLIGEFDSGGRTQLQGQWLQPSQKLTLKAKTKELEVFPLLGFIPADLPLVVNSGQVDGEFDVVYQPQQPTWIKAKAQITDGNAQLKDPEIQVAAKTIKTDLNIIYQPEEELPSISGNVQVRRANASIPEDLILQTGRSRFQRVQQVNGTLKFLEESKRVQFDLAGDVTAGGRFQTEGVAALDLSETNVLLRAQSVPAALMDRAYQLPINVTTGRVSSNLLIKLRQDQKPYLKGWAQLRNVDASITGMPNNFYNANGDVRVEGLTATLSQVQARYGQVPLIARGKIDPDRGYNLSVKIPPAEIKTALRTLQVEELPVPIVGRVEVPNLRVTGGITTPVLTGTVQNQGETTIDRVPFQTVAADFRLVLPNLQIQNILAKPVDGGQVTGNASYRISPGGEILASLQATGMPGDAIAQRYGATPSIKVGAIAAQINVSGQPTNPLAVIDFQAPQAVYSTVGQVVAQAESIRLQNIVSQVAGGQVFTGGLIRDGQLTAQVQPRGLVLNTFSPDLRGTLSGSFDIAAPLANLSARTLRADGDLRLSEGVSIIESPIDSAIAWDGRQIVLRRASAPGFNVSGFIGADLDNPTGPQLTTLDLALLVNDFPLQSLTALGPTDVELGGTTDLTGQISGTVSSPRLNSTLAVNNLAVAQVPFESRLAGNLAYNPQGTNLNLIGDRDRIQVALAPDFLPNRFLVQRDEAIARGQRNGDTLVASLEKFPLQMLNLQPAQDLGLGQVTGLASANVTANLNTYAATGSFAVQQPAIGRLVGDRFLGKFQYRDGLAQLIDGELQKRDSRYLMDVAVKLDDDPNVSGQLQVENGQIADVLYISQSFGGGSPAFGTAQDLQLESVGYPDAPLMIQLQRLAEVKEIIAQAEQERQEAPLSLTDLTGTMNGNIAFSGSANTGFSGNFDLLGSDFQWGEYSLDTVVAKGNLEGAGLNFEPLRFASGDRVAQYTGSLGIAEQSGQLILSQVPIDPLNQFLDLPVPVSGDINSVATIGGSLLDPAMKGELSLVQGEVNNVAAQEAKANFNYEQARLMVDGFARLDNPEPVTLTANIPYALPFTASFPDSDQIAVDVKVRDEGLGLVSLFTDQVAWVNGNGLVDLKVRGTLSQPLVNGTVAVQNATLTTPNIENPITAVNGKIQFDQNLIQVPQLVGSYDTGKILVSGSLPMTNSADAQVASNPMLTVNLNDLDLKLQSLYDGEVNGVLLVTGSALKPNIGGNVLVENGKVVLTEVASAGGDSESTDEEEAELALAEPSPIAFNQLQVTIGDRVRISQPPVLSFIATGNLTVNGALSDPKPEGRINFDKGTINLFTSRFRIDSSRENVAIFDPRYGVDPYLNVGMRATVVEVVQGRTSELSEFETVPASSLGSVDSVKIYAKVDGFASRLQTNFTDVVEISSDPRRTETEIIALLGGGVTEAVQAGQVQNAALNVASSALLGNVQDLLSGILGNKVTVNAFPVLLPNKDNDASVLAFGAEVDYEVTDRFSVSALQILTGVDQPTLFNLKYDLTDQLKARTSVSSDGEGVGLLEYRIRF